MKAHFGVLTKLDMHHLKEPLLTDTCGVCTAWCPEIRGFTAKKKMYSWSRKLPSTFTIKELTSGEISCVASDKMATATWYKDGVVIPVGWWGIISIFRRGLGWVGYIFGRFCFHMGWKSPVRNSTEDGFWLIKSKRISDLCINRKVVSYQQKSEIIFQSKIVDITVAIHHMPFTLCHLPRLVQLLTTVLTRLVQLLTAVLTRLVQLLTAVLTRLVQLLTAVLMRLVQLLTAVLTRLVQLLTAVLTRLVQLLTAVLMDTCQGWRLWLDELSRPLFIYQARITQIEILADAPTQEMTLCHTA